MWRFNAWEDVVSRAHRWGVCIRVLSELGACVAYGRASFVRRWCAGGMWLVFCFDTGQL